MPRGFRGDKCAVPAMSGLTDEAHEKLITMANTCPPLVTVQLMGPRLTADGHTAYS